MEKFNFFNPRKHINENYDEKIISYKNNINKLIKYLNDFDRMKKDENELDISLGISILSGAFYGDAFGSFFCDKSNSRDSKNENIYWTFYNSYYNTSKGQITDSGELSLSLAFGLIDAKEFDKNLVSFFYHYWYYSGAFNVERTNSNAFNLFRNELKTFNNYVKNKSELSEICLRNSRTYNENSISNGFLLRNIPLVIDFYFRNKSFIIECYSRILQKNDKNAIEEIFKIIFSYVYRDICLSHSYLENTLAASIYDYLIYLILSLNYIQEKNIFFFQDKKYEESNEEEKFFLVCEFLLEHLKLLINCDFMKIYNKEKVVLEKIKEIGNSIKKYTLDELIKNLNFTTNESDNNSENYIISLELLLIIIYHCRNFTKDIVSDNNQINLHKKLDTNENSNTNIFQNIIKFVCKVAGNNTNRNCYVIGAFFSSIFGFTKLGDEISDIFNFIPCLGYSVIENDKLKIKKIKNYPEKIIKYRPFMFSPGIIGFWVIFQKAKIENKLKKYVYQFFKFREFNFLDFIHSITKDVEMKNEIESFYDFLGI